MKITKLGHCCLVIAEKNLTILTDPGAYSTSQNEVMGIDIVLITHEHPDHLHIESLKKVLANNPEAEVITNASVGKILDREGIKYTVVADGESTKRREVTIEGFGTKHAYIYKTVTPVENTGYFIGDRLFYPGDAFTDPGQPVDILALPVAGPWMTISEALEYALKLKPKIAFPVHDGMFVGDRLGPVHRLPESVLIPAGLKFVVIKEGATQEF